VFPLALTSGNCTVGEPRLFLDLSQFLRVLWSMHWVMMSCAGSFQSSGIEYSHSQFLGILNLLTRRRRKFRSVARLDEITLAL
jgi:hypothetical protein